MSSEYTSPDVESDYDYYETSPVTSSYGSPELEYGSPGGEISAEQRRALRDVVAGLHLDSYDRFSETEGRSLSQLFDLYDNQQVFDDYYTTNFPEIYYEPDVEPFLDPIEGPALKPEILRLVRSTSERLVRETILEVLQTYDTQHGTNLTMSLPGTGAYQTIASLVVSQGEPGSLIDQLRFREAQDYIREEREAIYRRLEPAIASVAGEVVRGEATREGPSDRVSSGDERYQKTLNYMVDEAILNRKSSDRVFSLAVTLNEREKQEGFTDMTELERVRPQLLQIAAEGGVVTPSGEVTSDRTIRDLYVARSQEVLSNLYNPVGTSILGYMFRARELLRDSGFVALLVPDDDEIPAPREVTIYYDIAYTGGERPSFVPLKEWLESRVVEEIYEGRLVLPQDNYEVVEAVDNYLLGRLEGSPDYNNYIMERRGVVRDLIVERTLSNIYRYLWSADPHYTHMIRSLARTTTGTEEHDLYLTMTRSIVDLIVRDVENPHSQEMNYTTMQEVAGDVTLLGDSKLNYIVALILVTYGKISRLNPRLREGEERVTREARGTGVRAANRGPLGSRISRS